MAKTKKSKKQQKRIPFYFYLFFLCLGIVLGIGFFQLKSVVQRKPQFDSLLKIPDPNTDSYNEYKARLVFIYSLVIFLLVTLFIFGSILWCLKYKTPLLLCKLHPLVKISPFISFGLVFSLMNTVFRKKSPSLIQLIMLYILLLPFFILCALVMTVSIYIIPA